MAIRNGILNTEDDDILLPFGSDITDNVETTTAASKAYAKGDTFYSVPMRGLYEATAAIAKNATIASGTNCKKINMLDKIKSVQLTSVYPVGAIYLNTSNTNPATFLGFGTWTLMSEGYLKNGGASASGGSSTSGSTALTVNQIPAHTHTATTQNAGNHTHTATTQNTGAHTHPIYSYPRGSSGYQMPVEVSGWDISSTQISSEWYISTLHITNAANSSFYAYSAGSHAHTLTTQSTGAHTHTLTTQSIGGGQGHTHTVEPPYIRVYAFERTA